MWELVSDSRTQPELLEGQIVVLLSAFMSSRTTFIGTPTELSERIDPVGVERMSPKKVSRQILQNLDALRKIGISAVVRRSNGRRLIELQRAESDDTQGVPAVDPVDPAGALCSDFTEGFPSMASKTKSKKTRQRPFVAEGGAWVSGKTPPGGGQHAFVRSAKPPPPSVYIVCGALSIPRRRKVHTVRNTLRIRHSELRSLAPPLQTKPADAGLFALF